jgi:formylglycine-generating enzyme required for sulfatase activity
VQYKILRVKIEGSDRVVRGGAWNNNADNCRMANRNNNRPNNANNNNGFRIVLALQLRKGWISRL